MDPKLLLDYSKYTKTFPNIKDKSSRNTKAIKAQQFDANNPDFLKLSVGDSVSIFTNVTLDDPKLYLAKSGGVIGLIQPQVVP